MSKRDMDAEQGPVAKPFAFVLMPFEKSFDDVYKIGIKEACEHAGMYCERVDEQEAYDGTILQRIYNQISKADIIVADMTGRNANVFYEVGFAHALKKRVILLTNDASDIPFDLVHYPHLVYSDGVADLRTRLTDKVKRHLANPEVSSSQFLFPIDVSILDNYLSPDGVNSIKISNTEFRLRRSIDIILHNISQKVLLINDLELYVEARFLRDDSLRSLDYNDNNVFDVSFIENQITGNTTITGIPKRNILPGGLMPLPLFNTGDTDGDLTVNLLTTFEARKFRVKFDVSTDPHDF